MIRFFGNKILRIGILFIFFTGCKETVILKETMIQQMEINDFISQKKIDLLIRTHFIALNPENNNPIFPYKINFHLQSRRITFCSIPVIDGWGLISKNNYTLFLLLPKLDLHDAILRTYGRSFNTMEIEIDGRSDPDPMYSWDSSEVKIIIHKYRSLEKRKDYDNCYMVIIGNMNYEDVVLLPKF